MDGDYWLMWAVPPEMLFTEMIALGEIRDREREAWSKKLKEMLSVKKK